MKFRLTVITFIGILAILAGTMAYQRMDTKIDPSTLHLTLFNQPRALPSFNLIDSDGKPFTEKNFQKKWTMVFFGFTQCGSLCPTTLATLANTFKNPHLHKKVKAQVVFITVDPEYDTPQRLKDYLNHFNANFIGLTGDPALLTNLREQLGILAIHNMNNHQNQADSIDHSGAILLINPHGQYVGLFSMPHNAEEISADLQRLSHA